MDSIYQLKIEDKEKFVNTLSDSFIHNKSPFGCVTDDNRRLLCLKQFFTAEFDSLFDKTITLADSPDCNSIIMYGEKKELENPESSIFQDIKNLILLKLKCGVTFSELSKFKTLTDNYATLIKKIKLEDLEKYYIIEYFGTKTEMQGKGYGSRLMKAVLKKADENNKKIYIESEERNIKIYEHYGFKVIDKSEVLEGTNFYVLVREPISQNNE